MSRVNTKLLRRTAAVLLTVGCTETDAVIGPPEGPEGPLTIQSTTPSPNATTAGASDDLFVLFDRALDPATVTPSDVRVFGRWSGVVDGSVSLTDEGRTLRFSPSRPFSAGESVTVTIPRGAIRGVDAAETPHGFTWTFWVSVTATSMTFEPVATVEVRNPGEDRIQTYGAYAGDLDGDGWSDMIVPNEESNDLRVFMNDGAGGYGPFTTIPVPGVDRPSTSEGADFDGDGDIDFAVGSALGSKVAVFHGDGAGGLVHMQNLEAGAGVRGLCILDFENDGDPDLVTTSRDADHVSLFANDGSGAFALLGTIDAGEGEWSCAVGDLNEDGLVDFVVGARLGFGLIPFLSNGDGSFVPGEGISAGGDSWMLASGDLNGDGHVDFAGVNATVGSLAVYLGDGQGGLFLDQNHMIGGFPLAIDLGDLDGDGDLDAVSSHFRDAWFQVHENIGGGALVGIATLEAPEAASCTILHDRDNDGDLDISGIDEMVDLLILFENR